MPLETSHQDGCSARLAAIPAASTFAAADHNPKWSIGVTWPEMGSWLIIELDSIEIATYLFDEITFLRRMTSIALANSPPIPFNLTASTMRTTAS